MMPTHQYIKRDNGEVVSEHLLADRCINLLYSQVRERAPNLFRALTSHRASDLLSRLNFEGLGKKNLRKTYELIHAWGVDVSEFVDEPQTLDTPHKLFTRKIRYWECRPLEADPSAVASPADARLLVGSFSRESLLFIKKKFFDFRDFIGGTKRRWLRALETGTSPCCALPRTSTTMCTLR